MEGDADPTNSQSQILPEHIANLTSNTATSYNLCPELSNKVTACVLPAPSYAAHWQAALSCAKAASKSQRAKAAAGSQGADGNAMLKIVGGGTYIQVN